jgi:hypothetical protein
MLALKRTAALAAAAVTVVAVASCSSASPAAAPVAISSASSSPSAAPTPTAPVAPSALSADAEAAVAQYVDRFTFETDADADSVWLDADGVEDEFRAAAAAFPLALPDAYTWPATTGREYGNSAQWERGTGVVQAYFFWEGATATAAYAALERGDGAAVSAHLEALATGYASPVRSMLVDPEQPGTDSGYYRSVIAPALQGDWDTLIHAQVEPFVDNPAYRAIAAQAGDDVEFGTEGFATPAAP